MLESELDETEDVSDGGDRGMDCFETL